MAQTLFVFGTGLVWQYACIINVWGCVEIFPHFFVSEIHQLLGERFLQTFSWFKAPNGQWQAVKHSHEGKGGCHKHPYFVLIWTNSFCCFLFMYNYWKLIYFEKTDILWSFKIKIFALYIGVCQCNGYFTSDAKWISNALSSKVKLSPHFQMK